MQYPFTVRCYCFLYCRFHAFLIVFQYYIVVFNNPPKTLKSRKFELVNALGLFSGPSVIVCMVYLELHNLLFTYRRIHILRIIKQALKNVYLKG